MEDNAEVTTKKFKNKKKSRYKKFLKNRHSNKACEIDPDGYKYFTRISEVFNTVKNDEYEMEVLAGNVLNEVQGNEISYSKTNFTSKLLEELLPYSEEKAFFNFIQPFLDNLRPIFSDRTASHMLQTIIIDSYKRWLKVDTSSEDNKSVVAHINNILKIARFALNNVEEFTYGSSSNHVLRTVLNVLSGYPVKGDISGFQQSDSKKTQPVEFRTVLEKIALTLISLPEFCDLCNQIQTSGLLQTLLIATKDLEGVSKTILKKIVSYYVDKSVDLKECKNEPLLRFLEVALNIEDKKARIYNKFLLPDLKGLVVSKSGNYIVQKLIRNCNDKEQFDVIFDTIQEVAEDVLLAGHTGVFLELAQGCLRLKTKQGEFVKLMLRVLKCTKTLNEDSDIAPLTCCMVTSNKFDPEAMKLNLHGTLIVQAMLNFGKPIKIINSLLNLETKQLLHILADPRGCHITDAFIQSLSVGEKSRDRLFKKLIGCYTELVTSKHGSRSVDAIWNGITMKNKIQLMEELKLNESQVTASQFGKLFAHKTYLMHFRRHREEWIKRESSLLTTTKCFSDIIPAYTGK